MEQKDITALLYRIKENIRSIEGGDTQVSLLDEVRADFLSMIELIKLFLISERDSYYGYFMMNMQFRANFRCSSIAGIKLNEFPPVFESNPLLLCKFRLKEVIYIACHEIDHVLLNHPAEMVKANPTGDQQTFYEFNLAADAAVNDRINYEIQAEKHGFLAQPDGVITSDVLAKMFALKALRPMESYAYYFGQIKGKQGKDPRGLANSVQSGAESMMRRQMEKDDSESAEGASNDDQEKGKKSRGGAGDSEEQKQQKSDIGTGNDQDPNREPDVDREKHDAVHGVEKLPGDGNTETDGAVVTAANCGGHVADHDWDAGIDPEDAAAAVRELVNAAANMMSEESRGLMPAHFFSEVEKLNKPPVLSWQAILKKYVGTISASKRKTRTRLNRRQPERFDLSGTMDHKILKIVVAIDTSASVDNNMIKQILNEIFAILAKRRHEITIIECDAEVQRVYRAKTPADIQNKVLGRGGTWFSPVINYINNDRYFRDALLIYFTDGYGEYEIPKPRTYRNLWVVIGGAEHLSLKEPYGAVLSL